LQVLRKRCDPQLVTAVTLRSSLSKDIVSMERCSTDTVQNTPLSLTSKCRSVVFPRKFTKSTEGFGTNLPRTKVLQIDFFKASWIIERPLARIEAPTLIQRSKALSRHCSQSTAQLQPDQTDLAQDYQTSPKYFRLLVLSPSTSDN
jgi:hypothetical protein